MSSFGRKSEVLAALYPLRVGMRSRYALEQTRSDGQVVQRTMLMDVVDLNREDSGDVVGTTLRTYEDFRFPATRVRISGSSVRVSRASEPETAPSLVLLQTPLSAGREWAGRTFADGSTETVQYRGLESVDGPVGVVRAHRVDHLIRYAQGGSDRLQYWYAPGWGAVRMIERTTLFTNKGRVHLSVLGVLQGIEEQGAQRDVVPPSHALESWLIGGWLMGR